MESKKRISLKDEILGGKSSLSLVKLDWIFYLKKFTKIDSYALLLFFLSIFLSFYVSHFKVLTLFLVLFLFRNLFYVIILFLTKYINKCNINLFVYEKEIGLFDSTEHILTLLFHVRDNSLIIFKFDSFEDNRIFFHLSFFYCMGKMANFRNVMILVFSFLLIFIDTLFLLVAPMCDKWSFLIYLFFNFFFFFYFLQFLHVVENVFFLKNEFLSGMNFFKIESKYAMYVKDQNGFKKLSFKQIAKRYKKIDYAIVGAVAFVAILTFLLSMKDF